MIPALFYLLGLLAAQAEPVGTGWRALMRGDDEAGYALPAPDRELRLPEDHGAHPDFALEWWYLTANLTDARGRPHGVQWTLFRHRLPGPGGEGWESPQVFLAHAAWVDGRHHIDDEKSARGGIGQAGVTATPFQAWIDDWQWRGEGPAPVPGTLQFDVDGHEVSLQLTPTGPWILQGVNGYSVKSADGALASHYYSLPFIAVSGHLQSAEGRLAVTGQAWLDREWSSRFLDDRFQGWDWFGLHLDSGAKLMLFQVRPAGGQPFRQGLWVEADGRSERLDPEQIELQPGRTLKTDGAEFPVVWRLSIPSRAFEVSTEPLIDDQRMHGSLLYWEGAIRFEGTHSGVGYQELTGY